MKAILLAIKPEYVDKILSGEKKYEYRTRIAKEKVKIKLSAAARLNHLSVGRCF